MNWQIRRSRSEDLNELRRIYLEVRTVAFSWMNSSAFTTKDFDAATQDEPVLVASLNNKPIGFISWWPPDTFIHNLYLDPRFVGLGIGKALLNECLSKIGRPATLKCLQQNVNALRFYQSQGWSIQAEGVSDEGPYYLMIYNQ